MCVLVLKSGARARARRRRKRKATPLALPFLACSSGLCWRRIGTQYEVVSSEELFTWIPGIAVPELDDVARKTLDNAGATKMSDRPHMQFCRKHGKRATYGAQPEKKFSYGVLCHAPYSSSAYKLQPKKKIGPGIVIVKALPINWRKQVGERRSFPLLSLLDLPSSISSGCGCLFLTVNEQDTGSVLRHLGAGFRCVRVPRKSKRAEKNMLWKEAGRGDATLRSTT